MAIRTASHGFAVKGELPEGLGQWATFDDDVLGGNYHGHYQDADGGDISVVAAQAKHPILAGIEPAAWHAAGELYQTSPVADDATILLEGSIAGHPKEPVAWVRAHNRARVFYTSLGHQNDFKNPKFRSLLVNALFWAVQRTPPEGKPGEK